MQRMYYNRPVFLSTGSTTFTALYSLITLQAHNLPHSIFMYTVQSYSAISDGHQTNNICKIRFESKRARI